MQCRLPSKYNGWATVCRRVNYLGRAYVTSHLGQLSLPSLHKPVSLGLRGVLSLVSALGLGWQVTLCDPYGLIWLWQVTPGSSETEFHWSSIILNLTYTLQTQNYTNSLANSQQISVILILQRQTNIMLAIGSSGPNMYLLLYSFNCNR